MVVYQKFRFEEIRLYLAVQKRSKRPPAEIYTRIPDMYRDALIVMITS